MGMRNWFKSIIFECLEEIVQDRPLIISNRSPVIDDRYAVGTRWKTPKDIYVCGDLKATWIKLEDGDE